MKWMKTLLIMFALVAGTAIIATAQEGYSGWQDRSWQRDHDRDRDRDRASQWGYQQDRDWDRDQDRDRDRARKARKHRRGDGDGDADDGYYGNNQGVYGPYNRNPYYRQGIQQARENGYQWGVRDGQVDRQAGRSYRATTNETYRNANIGYVSAYGDKNQYRSEFRQAYEQGYQRAYGSGPYRGQIGRVPWGR